MKSRAMWSLDSLKKMDPYDFELLVGDLFEAMGYTTQVTPRSRDFGVDIFTKLEHFGLSHSWIVQAKKYNGNVGVREIREYGSLTMRDHVDGVIIVTTGCFTKDAVEEADQYNVKLISGDILVGMLNRYLVRPLSGKDDEVKELKGKVWEASDILLHENEEIMLREPVIVDGARFELILSNKNIFLKEVGFLSKKATLKHKIPISKVIGATREKNGILLFIAGENIQTCLIKGVEKIVDVLDQVKSYMPGQSEKLMKHSRFGRRIIILTNKRLFFQEKEKIWQIPLHRISGVDIKNGLIFRNSKIVAYITGETIEQMELIVDDAKSWKSDIEAAVRSSRVS